MSKYQTKHSIDRTWSDIPHFTHYGFNTLSTNSTTNTQVHYSWTIILLQVIQDIILPSDVFLLVGDSFRIFLSLSWRIHFPRPMVSRFVRGNEKMTGHVLYLNGKCPMSESNNLHCPYIAHCVYSAFALTIYISPILAPKWLT